MRTDIVEASEFPDLAQRYSVYAVPKTVINETAEVVGAVPEDALVKAVAAAATPPAASPASSVPPG